MLFPISDRRMWFNVGIFIVMVLATATVALHYRGLFIAGSALAALSGVTGGMMIGVWSQTRRK